MTSFLVIIPTYDPRRSYSVQQTAAAARSLGMTVRVVCNSAESAARMRILGASAGLLDDGKNLGFGKAVNAAARDTTADYIIVVNDDVSEVHSALVAIGEHVDQFDLLGIGRPYQVQRTTPLAAICRFSLLSTAWHRIRSTGQESGGAVTISLSPGRKPPFAMFGIRRAVFEELGGFDARFPLYFEDDALCILLERRGGSVGLVAHELLHEGSGTTRVTPYASLACQAYGFRLLLVHYHGLRPALASGITAVACVVRALLVLFASGHSRTERLSHAVASIAAVRTLLRAPKLPRY